MALLSNASDTSSTQSLYPTGIQDLSAYLSDNVLKQFILPYQKDEISGWSSLGRGDFGKAPNIEGPAASAGLQGMAQGGALTSGLAANVAAPLQESVAAQARGIPGQLKAAAPDQLAGLVKALIDPNFADFLRPGTSSTSTKGGSSDLSSGLAVGSTLATLAELYTKYYA